MKEERPQTTTDFDMRNVPQSTTGFIPTPHTDQFEEMKEEFEIWWKFECVDYPPCEKIAEWWLSKLHHIRRETEKEMREFISQDPEVIIVGGGNPTFIHMEGQNYEKKRILSHLESDNSPQK